jgi:hypothetical protein
VIANFLVNNLETSRRGKEVRKKKVGLFFSFVGLDAANYILHETN